MSGQRLAQVGVAPTTVEQGARLRDARRPGWSSERLVAPEPLVHRLLEWEALSARAGLPIIGGAAWTASFWEAFGAAGEPPEVHLLRRDGQLEAVLPVRRQGRLLRRLVSLENEHNPFCTVPLARPDPELAGRLLSVALADAESLDLRRLSLESPTAHALETAATGLGFPSVRVENPDGGDCFVRLDRTPAQLEAKLPRGLRRDARPLRRLVDQGRARLEVVSEGPALASALAACLALERAGWKGSRGTSIASRADTLCFYSALAERASRAGGLALYLLYLDDALIAFNYTLRGAGRIDDLKTAYDERHAKLSPGTTLLLLALLHECAAQRFGSYHFGRPNPLKRRWADQVAPLGTLRIFAPTARGEVGYLLSTRVRRRIKALPGVARAVALARAARARRDRPPHD